MTTGFEIIDLTPDTSYMRETIDVQTAAFGGDGNLGSLLYVKDVDYTNVAVQVAIQKLQSDVLVSDT